METHLSLAGGGRTPTVPPNFRRLAGLPPVSGGRARSTRSTATKQWLRPWLWPPLVGIITADAAVLLLPLLPSFDSVR